MKLRIFCASVAAVLFVPVAWAGFLTYESAGITPAAITSTRDAFRSAVGGGAVARANFFNVNSPRRAVFSTAGTGFLVSVNAGLAI